MKENVKVGEMKQAEKSNQEGQEKYRSLFENMLNGFAYCQMLYDDKDKPVDFIYLEVNDAFEKLTGIPRQTVLGKKVTEAIPGIKQATPELFDIYGRVASTGKGEKFEIFFTPLNIWLYISVYSPKRGYFAAVFENVTERKKAQEELKKSTELLRAIIESAQDMIIIKDTSGRTFYANSEALKIFGKPNWQVIGKTAPQLFGDQKISEAITKSDRQLVETKQAQVVEEPVLTPQGKRVFLATKSPWLDSEGKVIGIIVISRDITRRIEMEQELKNYNQRLEQVVAQRTAEYVQANEKLTMEVEEHRKTEEQLKLRATILDNAGQAIFLVNLKGDFVYANNAACRLYGYSHEEFPNLNLRKLLQPEDASKFDALLKKVLENGHLERKTTHIQKDGRRIEVHVRHTLIQTNHGQFIVSAICES